MPGYSAQQIAVMQRYQALDSAKKEQRSFEARSLYSEFHAETGTWGLHYATDPIEVKKYIDIGAPINGVRKIEYGDSREHWETPLLTAIVDQRYDVARALIKEGADINAPNAIMTQGRGGMGHSTLYMAVAREDIDATQFLIEAGADVNLQTTMGSAPLHTAARDDNNKLVEVLLAAGADVSLQEFGDGNESPAHYAGLRTRHLFEN